MGTFSYKLKSLQGTTSKGVISAQNLEAARSFLASQDAILISVKPLKIWETFFQKPELSPREILALFKPLAQLCRAGIPLLEALTSLSNQHHNKSYHTVVRLLEQGLPLSQALEKSTLMSNLILLSFLRRGEASGDYPQAFDQIVQHLQWLEALKKRLKKSLSYPTLVLGLSLALMIFLMSFVIPQLLDLYTMSGLETPSITQSLITFSNILPVVLGGIVALLAALTFLILVVLTYGRYTVFLLKRLLNLILQIPLLGKVFRDILLLQYIKNMHALLMSQKENILGTMTCAENSLSPKLFQKMFILPRLLVEQGGRLSHALQQQFSLPETIFKLIETGEKSGSLTTALHHSALYIDAHLQEKLDKTIQRLGPIMLLMVGGLLIFIISAIFLPLYSGLGDFET